VNLPVAIIIVSYNCREPLRACLRSLQTGKHTIVVVDNASADNTTEMLRREFPSVTLIENPENHGFAAACNQGVRATDEPFVLLLNPDTIVELSALLRLLQVMRERPDVGACGPRILNPDGTLQPSCRRFPTLGTMLLAELGWRRRYLMRDWQHDDTREVDQLMGSCLLLRREALEQVGLLDERFFLYFEEVDLCWRLKQAGWRVLFVHDATIIHSAGASTKTAPQPNLVHRYRSLFEFYRKHFPRWQLLALKMGVFIGTVARSIRVERDYWAVARRVWKL
jgi:GT2 family glycosyltransferase